METLKKRYRVDGRDDYAIELRPQQNGTYKIFATGSPDDVHGKGPSVHHRYSTGEICIAEGSEPQTADRATALALAWIDGYAEYLRSGSFPSGSRRIRV